MAADLDRIVAAAGAIIVPDEARYNDGGNRFSVHQRVRDLTAEVGMVVPYLESIFSAAGVREESPMPSRQEFAACSNSSQIVQATQSFAYIVADAIGRKVANAGLLLSFVGCLSDATDVYGVLKVDFETDPRNHIDLRGDDWSLEEVEDVLPTPRADVAKYAIVLNSEDGIAAWVRDVTTRENDPAVYWLDALDVSRERTEGTLAAIANAAREVGYQPEEIAAGLTSATPGRDVRDLVATRFPRISDDRIDRITSEESRRPRRTVPDGDGIKEVWTSVGYANVVIDNQGATVRLSHDGREMTIGLPEGAPPFDRPIYRAARRKQDGG